MSNTNSAAAESGKSEDDRPLVGVTTESYARAMEDEEGDRLGVVSRPDRFEQE